MAIKPLKPPLPGAVAWLETIGFKFSVDFDGELLIEAPPAVDVARLKAVIEQHYREQIADVLLNRERFSRIRCYGGPCDGQPHMWHFRYLGQRDAQGKHIGYADQFEGVSIARGKWAVYRVLKDRRAFFVGYATSEQKARRGLVKPTEAKG